MGPIAHTQLTCLFSENLLSASAKHGLLPLIPRGACTIPVRKLSWKPLSMSTGPPVLSLILFLSLSQRLCQHFMMILHHIREEKIDKTKITSDQYQV